MLYLEPSNEAAPPLGLYIEEVALGDALEDGVFDVSNGGDHPPVPGPLSAHPPEFQFGPISAMFYPNVILLLFI
jgi:hypothetical protein